MQKDHAATGARESASKAGAAKEDVAHGHTGSGQKATGNASHDSKQHMDHDAKQRTERPAEKKPGTAHNTGAGAKTSAKA